MTELYGYAALPWNPEIYDTEPDGQWPVPAENLRRIQAQLEANYGWPKPNSPS